MSCYNKIRNTAVAFSFENLKIFRTVYLNISKMKIIPFIIIVMNSLNSCVKWKEDELGGC